MTIEKKLNTRIQLKYDTYAGWTDTSVANQGANLVLKPGEIGICAIPGGSTAVNGDTTRPQIMFKVGDTEGSPFSALPWASAKAADVYGWAKAAGLTVEKSGEGNVVSNIKWENNKIVFETAAVATSEGLQDLQNRVVTLEENFASDAELAAAVATLNGNITALADGAVKTNTDAIAAIKDGTAIDSFADVEAALEDKQEVGDYATKAEAQSYANAKDTAIAEAKQAGTDAAAALEAYKTSNDTAVGKKADQTALDAVSAVANAAATQAALEAEIARAQAAEEANANAITLLTNGVDQDKVDGVKDLIDYVEVHGPEVTGMKEDIADNAQAITDEAARATDEEERLAGLIQANADAIEALGGENGKVAAAAQADNAAALGGVAAENYLQKTDAPGYNDILTTAVAAETYQPKGEYATAAQGTLADTAVQPDTLNNYYTKTEANNEFMNADEVDAKIEALNLAETYATVAQGTKADTALQTVAAGTGLKVSEKADNSQTIEIDDTVVFVLNCGSASEVNN